MGIQIHIKSKDMLKAGWTQGTEGIEYFEVDGEGNEYQNVYHFDLYIKGDTKLRSYTTGAFFADCNDWGSNKALFQSLGLFDIPHILS